MLRKAPFDDKISYYSASLSFYTLFSIIPLLVIVLSILTHLPIFDEIYNKIENILFENLMPTYSKEILTYINSFVANSAKLGIIGVIYVLFASMMFFKNYDYVVNDIFESNPRSFWASVSLYWTLITLTPIMLVLSFYLSGEIQFFLNKSRFTAWVEVISILPYIIIWSIFFLTYKYRQYGDS